LASNSDHKEMLTAEAWDALCAQLVPEPMKLVDETDVDEDEVEDAGEDEGEGEGDGDGDEVPKKQRV
jgi:hypothetical protein